jgi:hypothetical protein
MNEELSSLTDRRDLVQAELIQIQLALLQVWWHLYIKWGCVIAKKYEESIRENSIITSLDPHWQA